MIIKDNLEFHAAELHTMPGISGQVLVRIPAEIGNRLNQCGGLIFCGINYFCL